MTIRSTHILSLSLLIASTLTQATSVKISGVSFNATSLGEILGAIWKVSIIICLILMIVDAVMRFTGRRLGVFHSVRFIWFIYGTACAWAVGGLMGLTTPYRFFNDSIFSQFLEEIY